MPSSQLGQTLLGQWQLGQVDSGFTPPPSPTPAAEILAALQFFENPVRLKVLSENLGTYAFVETSIPPNYGELEASFVSSTYYQAPRKFLKENLGTYILTEYTSPIPVGLEGVASNSFTEYNAPQKRLKENLGSYTLVEFSSPVQVAEYAAFLSSTEYNAPRKSLRQPNGSFSLVRDFPRTVVNLLQPIVTYPERTWKKPPPNPSYFVLPEIPVPNPLRQCELETLVTPVINSSGVDPHLVAARIVAVLTYRGDPVC